MAMVNIPSTNDDPSYRYKMPRLVTAKEGRGNGSKTCIKNMSDVARALRRPPQYTTKWFGAELGAQSTYTNKEGEGERAIVNGHHDTPIFQTMLDKFIDKYVLCENCRLPELSVKVSKSAINAKCLACGWSGELDGNHKLAAFIMKNPPDETGHNIVNLNADTGGKKSKDEKRKEREQKRQAKGDDDDDDEEADEKPKKEKKEKKERGDGEKKEKKERKEKKEKKEKDGDEDPEAKAARRAERAARREAEGGEKKSKKEKKEKKSSSSNKKKEADSDASDDDNKEEELTHDGEVCKDVAKTMEEWIKSNGGADKVKPADYFEELRMHQLAKDFNHKLRFSIALDSLFPDGAMSAKAMTDNIKKVIDAVLNAVALPKNEILWCFGAYLDRNEAAVKGYPMVLKVIYEEDWAKEQDILKYYVEDGGQGDPAFDAAKKVGAPFFQWLQTEESSDDDDDSGSGSGSD